MKRCFQTCDKKHRKDSKEENINLFYYTRNLNKILYKIFYRTSISTFKTK